MKEELMVAILAVLLAILFFCVLYMQTKMTDPLEHKADMQWCDISFGDSKATIPCERVSRLD